MTLIRLPAIIPLFPLTGAILMPKGHLPLNVFEPRYKQMVEMARENDGIIGMIQPTAMNISDSEQENDLYGTAKRGRELYNVGCAGLITGFEETSQGQYFIILTGQRRFKIDNELPMKHSFRQAEVSYVDYQHDGTDSDISSDHKSLFLDTVKKYFKKIEINVDLKSFEDIGDEELINSMAMICPFDAAEKQLLLETAPLLDRADLMIKLMDFILGQHNISSENNIH